MAAPQQAYYHCFSPHGSWPSILSAIRDMADPALFLEARVLDLLRAHVAMSASPNDGGPSIIEQVKALIDGDLSRHYTLEQLARKFAINEFDLKRRFKTRFDMSIYRYLTKARMERARQELLYSEKPIYQIAASCGYRNASHFSKWFKVRFEVSPKELRKGGGKHLPTRPGYP